VTVFSTARLTSGTAYTRCPDVPANAAVTSGEDCLVPGESRNQARLPTFKQIDLRVTKGFALGQVDITAYFDIRNLFDARIARVAAHAEDDDAQPHPDLRCGEPGAVQMRHRIAHVGEQLGEFLRREALDRFGTRPQARIPHLQDFADHRATSFSMIRRTLPIASSSTAPICSRSTACALPPRPAAKLATTPIEA